MSSLPAVHENGSAAKPAEPIKVPLPKAGTLEDFRAECRARIAARNDAFVNHRPLGPLVGISKEFAEQFGGHFEQGVIVFHASPGSGKSALCAQLLAECRCAGLYITFEMSKYQLIDRHLARENNEFIGKFRTGEMTSQGWDELFDNAHKKNPGLKNIHILDAMQTRTSIEEIEEAAIAARGSSPHLLVIIDSAHAMVRALRQGGKVSAYDATEDTITQVQQLSARLEATFIIIGEQNRNERGGKGQAACANASIYEYGTHQVVALVRDQEVKPDRHGEVPVTAVFAKNRDGQQGFEVGLKFRCKTMGFRGDPDFVASSLDDEDDE